MKVLAIIDVMPETDITQLRASLEEELRGSWQLYREGKIREAFTTESARRIVFVMEDASADEARRSLSTLPLIAKGLLHLEVIELRPFLNWSILFRP